MTKNDPLSAFAQSFPSAEYDKNQVILAAGVESHYFYYLETGAVKMTRISKEGRNMVLHIFFSGSVFSLITLVNHDFNQYDFIAQTPKTVIRKIPRRQLQEFLRSNPDALYDLNLRLLHGLTGLLKRIETRTLTSAYNQVAGLLLYFARHFPTENSSTPLIEIKVTHQELAEWLGLTRENVSLQMKRLENNGLIKLKKHHIQLEKMAELRELAETVSNF